MVMDSVPPPHRPIPSAMEELQTTDSDGNTWIRKDGQWVPKMKITVIDPDTDLDPYAMIKDRITEEQLEEMWNLCPADFEIWKSKQHYQNWKLIEQAEETEKRKTEEARSQRLARKDAQRSQNPLWGAFK